MDFYMRAEEIKEEIIRIRRQIHQNPELGFNEFETSKLVSEKLTEVGIEIQTGVGGTGVIGLLKGKYPGRTIALRADMDALPIVEQTGLDFTSKNQGVMHACGHDFHTSILIGAAMILSKLQDQLYGNIKFIFQPAEETMGGAKKLLEEGVLEHPKVDAIICLHCWPELPAGSIGIRRGPIMAASDFLNITIHGKGGHAAHPHKCIDPLPIAGHVLNSLQTIVSREIAPTEPAVVTIGQIHGGTSNNVIAPSVELSGTVRTINPETRTKIAEIIQRIVYKQVESMKGKVDINYQFGSPPLICDDGLVTLMDQTVKKVLGDEKLIYLDHPSLGGEDFAFYLEKVPGILFRLGTANEEEASKLSLHNPSILFEEEALVPGIAVMCSAALDYLNQ